MSNLLNYHIFHSKTEVRKLRQIKHTTDQCHKEI